MSHVAGWGAPGIDRLDPNTAIQPTLREARELHDNTGGLAPKAQRQFDKWLAGRERFARTRQTNRYTEDTRAIEERHAEVRGGVELVHEECEDLIAGLRSGRISAAIARRQAAEVFKVLQQLREWTAEARTTEAEAWEKACEDPADAEDALLRDMPNLRQTLPRLSNGYLSGDTTEDPFTTTHDTDTDTANQ